MKERTFTVLFIDEYDPANGVVMTDEEAIKELRDELQSVYDDTSCRPGTNFLIVEVEDGTEKFWAKWKEAK